MRVWVFGLCALTLTTASVSAAASVLVVRSTGPSAKIYAMGKALPDNSKITLKANDSVTLLDSRGTRTLRGPGTFDVSVSSGGSTSALAALSGSTASRRRVGATRGGDATRGAPTGATAGRNIWQADISRSGNVCMVDPADAGLYRSDADTAAVIAIRDTTSGQSAECRIRRWTAQRIVAGQSGDGCRAPISDGAGKQKVTLTARSMGSSPPGWRVLPSG